MFKMILSAIVAVGFSSFAFAQEGAMPAGEKKMDAPAAEAPAAEKKMDHHAKDAAKGEHKHKGKKKHEDAH